MSDKSLASDTKNTGKVPDTDAPGAQVLLQQTPRNIMSYSGADFTFLLYVPIASTTNYHDVVIQGLDDEILELTNQRNILEAKTNVPLAEQFSLNNRVLNLNQRIDKIEKTKTDIRKHKSNIVPIRLNTLQTLSIQIHVDKQPVRGLGHAYPKGYTRGARLVAGSMIFTVMKEHPLVRIIDIINAGITGVEDSGPGDGTGTFRPHTAYDLVKTTATVDHLPPMHLTIMGVNEAGNAVNMTIFGIEFINDGMVLSIQDILTESTISFVAQDIDIMRTLDTRGPENIPAMSRAVTTTQFLNGPIARARRARRGLPF